MLAKRPLIAFVMTIAALGACASDLDTEVVEDSSVAAEPSGLTLRFEHRFGDRELVAEEAFQSPFGQTLRFDSLVYWISDVALGAHDQGYATSSAQHLNSPLAEERSPMIRVEVPAGIYDELVLHVGLPTTAASEDSPPLERHFFRSSGGFVEQGVTGRFEVKVGTDALFARLVAELDEPLDLSPGEEREVVVRADFRRLFAGVELSKTPVIEGGPVDSLAGKIAGNYARAFTLVTATGEVPLVRRAMPTATPELPSLDGTPPLLTSPLLDYERHLWCDAVPDRPLGLERACVTRLTPDRTESGGLHFVTENGAPVRSASDGVVTDVVFTSHDHLTHDDMFTVIVKPRSDSAFRLEYHHIKDLRVGRGDPVSAGDVMGGAGDHFAEDVGAFSFVVIRDQVLVQRLCPTSFGTPDFNIGLEQALALSNATWPDHGRPDLCKDTSLVCDPGTSPCKEPADLVGAQGDVDAGRRIYGSSCAGCHGPRGESALPLCSGPHCGCVDCVDHPTLAARTALDMPPGGLCDAECAADVAAYILYDFVAP